MKKMSPISKVIALASAGALVAFLAFAAPKGESEQTAKSESTETISAYPLDYCLVSGEKLGSMGDPIVKVYDGREVKFCCNNCVKSFEKDQAKYLKKLDDAVLSAQKADYPLETCVVSGEPLVPSSMGDPVDYMYNGRLVRFCCAGCIKTFNKEPAKYLAMLDAASTKSPEAEESHEGHNHAH